ncbi:Hpt domain-containing protein [Butyrivibrio sp. JL13D10]|uniref:Hpt domain-containing protein n=1 Tax=Butyrivibrio sp. JL13D10 TaxID=3236815 RepID=UPI0038B5980F
MKQSTLEILEEIDGISVKDGLFYCGTEKAFLKFLNSFYKNIQTKAGEIEEAYRTGDISFYTTKVHSLKSTSRLIGATELSELSYKLEEAGRENNLDFISENTQKLLDMFRSYESKLSILDTLTAECENNKKSIDRDELEEAYRSLAEIVESEDFDSAEMILDELEKCKLSDTDKELVCKLDKALKNFKWNEMEELLKH